MKNIFAAVKAAVTTQQAAEFYGLKVSGNGMTCCIFHNDRHPSMKVDERFYCFGCHKTGDVIDFTAGLFKLDAYEAAQKLLYDLHIDPNSPTPSAAHSARKRIVQQRDIEAYCTRVLVDSECLFRQWKEKYAPVTPEEEWDTRFEEACNELPAIENCLDLLYSPDEDLRKKTAEALINTGAIKRLEGILLDKGKEADEDVAGQSSAA